MAILDVPDWESNERDGRVLFNQLKELLETFQVAFTQLPVIDKDLTAPPGSPTVGDRYIVAATATDAWVGKDNSIAVRLQTEWAFLTPIEGIRLYVQDEDGFYLFDGTDWNADP